VLLSASHRAPGRPRCEVTHQAVLKAAYELLAEDGIGRFTIERVAARSGVARTTIYRWWPTKGALAMEGFLAAIAPEIEVPPTESVAADIRAQVRLFARLLRGTVGRITRGIIAAGQSDPETISAFMTGFVGPRRAEGRAILQRGIASGELRADLDVDLVLSGIFGPLYLRMLLNEGLDDAWVDRLVDSVIMRSLASTERTAEPVG
jgi:AcrR family transcriptional regulator